MKLCTFNVNSIRARKDLILDWLLKRSHDLDILCLQELKVTEDQFPFEEFQKIGFSCYVSGQKAYNGVAILSKMPAQDVRTGFGDPVWDEQKRMISVKINGIWIINIYAPHGGLRDTEKYHYKQRWFRALIQYLSVHHSPSDLLLIAGDINVAHKDKDVFSPEQVKDLIGTMPEERESLQSLLDWGLIDSFRHIHPETQHFTWWDYQTAAIWRDEGLRIDYILCTSPVIKLISEIEVDLWTRKRRKPTPSDHAPVIATLSK